MKQKKNPRFRFSGSIDMEIIRRQVKKAQKKRAGTVDDPDRRGSHDRDRNLSCD